MRARFALLGVLLGLACAGPDPMVECRRWQREGCAHLQRCGQVADVDACVAEHEALADSLKPCSNVLADAYCGDVGDDFAACADAVKTATCGDAEATKCKIAKSARSTCNYRSEASL